jgi:hypothetical protein
VFPVSLARGKRRPWPKPRKGGDGPLLYSNYRVQIWKAVLGEAGLVGGDAARRTAQLHLDAAGGWIEVATVTNWPGIQTRSRRSACNCHAVQGGEMAADALERCLSHRAVVSQFEMFAICYKRQISKTAVINQ